MIGIFDSGIGGLSIWQGIVQHMPDVSTLYLADQSWAPYGNRPVSDIKKRGYAITDFLKEQGATVIVIACNTATVNITVSHLRNKYPDLIFVGVEPPIKKLASLTKSGHIGLFATKATCQSKRVESLVDQYTTDISVDIIATLDWAELVEKNFPESETTNSVKFYLSQLSNNIDVVGLGCTHYPFLLPWLEHINPDIQYIDVVEPVAYRTQSLYVSHHERNTSHRFITTSEDTSILETALQDLLGIDSHVESILI